MHTEFQVRLGLIMKGGSSLAIYMNGMAQELLALVRASQARQLAARDPNYKPNRSDPYYKIVDELKLDVVIDVIAGTSAGGLNGLMLAKALASGAPNLDKLTGLWESTAQIGTLAAYDKDPKSVLSGDLMLAEMEKVMNDLSNGDPRLADEVKVLDLFVTATDYHGHRWVRRDGFNQKLEGKAHRYLFHLKKRVQQGDRSYSRNDFAGKDQDQQKYLDRLLAKIGRATSAFPAVFPPIRIGRLDGQAAGVPVLQDIPDAPEEGVWFSDGGILVNTPIEPVLQTVFKRSADRPVKRVLAFIEPDPAKVLAPGTTEPTMVQTGLSAVLLPMQQDILESLDRLNQENARRKELLRLVSDLEAAARSGGDDKPGGGESAQSIEASRASREALRMAAGGNQGSTAIGGGDSVPVRTAYYQARLHRLRSLLESALDAALEGLGVPGEEKDRRRSDAIKRVIDSIDYFQSASPESDGAVEFLSTYDFEYHNRRLHFMLARLHEYYRKRPGASSPSSEKVFQGLWGAVEDWNNASWMVGRAGRLPGQPGRWQAPADLLNQAFKSFAAAVMAGGALPVQELRDALGTFLTAVGSFAKTAESEALDLACKILPAQGDGSSKEMLPREFFERMRERFDSLDMVLFPLQTYGLGAEWDAPELIRFCPEAATLWLNKPGAEKLTGDALGHFAAFLDKRWRSNDIMWGRLDCAEILTCMLVRQAEGLSPETPLAEADLRPVVREALMERRSEIVSQFADLFDKDKLQAMAGRALGAAPSMPKLSWRQRFGYAFGALFTGQAAMSKLPPEKDEVAALGGVPMHVVQRYLQTEYNVGREGLEVLPVRRVAGETLMVLHNIAHALSKTAPNKVQQKINDVLLVFLRPLNWMARLVLLPREGVVGMVQANLIALMTLVGGVLFLLRVTKWATLSGGAEIAMWVLLFPFLLSTVSLIFRSTLLKAAGVVAGLALIATGVGALGSYLEPLASFEAWLEPLRDFWLVFVAGIAGYLLAGNAHARMRSREERRRRSDEEADLRKAALRRQSDGAA